MMNIPWRIGARSPCGFMAHPSRGCTGVGGTTSGHAEVDFLPPAENSAHLHVIVPCRANSNRLPADGASGSGRLIPLIIPSYAGPPGLESLRECARLTEDRRLGILHCTLATRDVERTSA